MVKLLKAGIILILLGIGASIAGFLTTKDEVGNDFSNQTYTLVEDSYVTGAISVVNMDLSNREVIVGRSTSDKIEVRYYVSENDPIEASEENNSLTFDSDIIWYWNFFSVFNWLNWNASEHFDFYLLLPEGTNFDLNIDTSNGVITVESLDNLGALDLNTSNGHVNLINVDSESIRVDTSNGIITVNNVDCGVSGNIDLRTSNGAINVLAVVTADLTCHTSNGSIDVEMAGEFSDYATNLATSNGTIYVDGNILAAGLYNSSNARRIILNTSNGSIHLDFEP
ncbi:MAG: DUF4097 family beta strand repeat-containing protein [Candidatus Izemoplasmatales bacterium]|nr:DUF4097 family beta strand repeat-containing protein [Candidatus Izemoplasmatales bacterium]